MKVSIVPSDQTVYKDGKGYLGIDLSWIPDVDGKTIHAIQWLDEDDDGIGEGEIEFVGPHQNLTITTLGIDGVCSFEKALHQWNDKRDEEEALHQEFLAEQERLRIEEQERIQAEYLDFEKNNEASKYLPDLKDSEEDYEDDGEEENIFYDIEELLKEI